MEQSFFKFDKRIESAAEVALNLCSAPFEEIEKKMKSQSCSLEQDDIRHDGDLFRLYATDSLHLVL